MPDRVVVLQLLSSYWLAVILPPSLCFSAIYNERTSAFSNLPPYSHHQGRKFGGYKIQSKPCKDMSSAEKEAGICMFNYECTQRTGTVVGSCMDGFLYGTCCKLPPGVSLSTIDVPETTPSKPYTSSASDRSTTLLKPHIAYSPEETFLLYKNGSVVQNVNSPEDFLFFSKQQSPLIPHTSPLPTGAAASNNNYYRLPSTTPSSATQSMSSNNRVNSSQLPINTRPSQTFDRVTMHTNRPITSSEPNHMSILYSSKPYTTTSSREPFSPNFSSTKFNTHTTKTLPQTSTMRTTDYFSQSSKLNFASTQYPPTMTNKNDFYNNDENLIRVPTLTANGLQHKYTANTSVSHTVWLLNDTRTEVETEDASTQPTQSFYTWLSVQNNPDKGSSYSATKPIHNMHHDSKPSTPLPSTTVHHIPGPSFHVTPEVKITPKPQGGVSESLPTVIVLSSAQDTASTPTKKPQPPIHSYTTTASYNVSYHYPQVGGSSSTKPYIKQPLIYSPSTIDKPTISSSVLITAKPSQTSTLFSTVRPQSSYISKPVGNNGLPNKGTIYTAVASTPKPSKTTTHISSSIQSYTKIKPVNGNGGTTSTILPSIMQSTVFTTAKPIWAGNLNSDTIVKPTFSQSPIPSYTNHFGGVHGVATPQSGLYGVNPSFSVYPGTNLIVNSTENIFDFPPVRNPNVNLTATQHDKPVIITSTTTFGDEELETSEVTPEFVVDKTLEDKMHVFVEKIVQSLQGNFEDLEKVLIVGESTDNVTVNTGGNQKITKKPTKKPSSVKPTLLSSTTQSVLTKKPTKKPSLATPAVLFQPSSTSQTTISLPDRKPPIKVTTTVSLSPSSLTTTPTSSSSAADEEAEAGTTTRIEIGSDYEPDYRINCGIRPLTKKTGRIVGGKGSTFGEWPWQVLVREATWLGLFTKNKCGGVLITSKYVITAAHCQPGFLANLVAVFGEFDISGEVESKRSVSKNVRRVIVHRQYDAATFENDIALLELESPIQFDAHIVPICMPEDNEEFTGRMATVTGWGRLKYGGGVPTILQEVQVPIMENKVCQEMFHTAGHPKVILPSFICAGYANGQRDSCEGDSGGPLMLERADGHWTLVATVSHGIKCAAPYLPGVYMRTTYYKPWLQTITGV